MDTRNNQKVGIPLRRELFEPLDPNFKLSDLKVLVLARLVVKLNLGEFSKLPLDVRDSLKKSVCTFYSQYTTKLEEGDGPRDFVEREKKWLDKPLWVDPIANTYIEDLQAGNFKKKNGQPGKDEGSDLEIITEVSTAENTPKELTSSLVDLYPVRKKRKSKKPKRLKSSDLVGPKRRGRPKKPWDDLSVTYKRKASYVLSRQHTVEELLSAAFHGAHKEYRVDVARAVKQCREILALPPQKADPLNDSKPVIPFTANEAVNFIMDSNLTSQVYQGIRLACKTKGAELFPTYRHVGTAKLLTYPKTIQVNQTGAQIPLQSLLNHTAERILDLSKHIIRRIKPTTGRLKVNLSVKWGYDGSSGSSEWRQRFLTDSIRDNTDADLFCTALIPLSVKNSDNTLWVNPTPASIRMCRPLSVQLGKETPELAFEAQAKIENQIRDLQPVIVTVDLADSECDEGYGDDETVQNIEGESFAKIYEYKQIRRNFKKKEGPIIEQEVQVFFHVQHTMIEPIATYGGFGTFSNKDVNCHICCSNPQTVNQFPTPIIPNPDAHRYVLSSNHAWVTCFETLVTLGSLLPQDSWIGRGDVNAQVAQRKLDIQKAFRKELNIIIDKPKAGFSVSTAEAASAKRAFVAEDEFSRLTGIDRELIHRFGVILTVLSCEYEVLTEEFGEYCLGTADYFMTQYRWFQLPTAVHKILYHGNMILGDFIVPIGMMSEAAQISRNKDTVSFSSRHAKNEGREQVMTEIIKQLMVLGDPMVSTADLDLRKLKQNWKAYEDDVLKLLVEPNIPDDLDINGLAQKKKKLFIKKDDEEFIEDIEEEHKHEITDSNSMHEMPYSDQTSVITNRSQHTDNINRVKSLPMNLGKVNRTSNQNTNAAAQFQDQSFIPPAQQAKTAQPGSLSGKLNYFPNLFDLAYQDSARNRIPYTTADLSASRISYQASSSKIQQGFEEPVASKATFHNPPPPSQANFHPPGSFVGSNFPYHQ